MMAIIVGIICGLVIITKVKSWLWKIVALVIAWVPLYFFGSGLLGLLPAVWLAALIMQWDNLPITKD